MVPRDDDLHMPYFRGSEAATLHSRSYDIRWLNRCPASGIVKSQNENDDQSESLGDSKERRTPGNGFHWEPTRFGTALVVCEAPVGRTAIIP